MSPHAPVHRLDEPTGNIPRHGCVPAEPASVSPGKIIVAPQAPPASTSYILGPFRQRRSHPCYPAIGKCQLTKLYAFVLAPLVLTLTLATAWGQASGGPETVVVHNGSATLPMPFT